MKIRVCFVAFCLFISYPSLGCAADLSSSQSSTATGGTDATGQSPERNLLKTGGAINKQLGGALSEYGQQRGGLIGMGARISGTIYTATGTAIEDVADNKKGVAQAHNDTFKAAVSAHKQELSGAKNTANNPPSVAQKQQAVHIAPSTSSGKKGAVGGGPPVSRLRPNSVAMPPPSEEETFIANLQSSDDEVRRNALREIHASQLIYNKAILDTAERVLLEQHMEEKGAVFSDSMSWICRVLADSGDSRYLDTLKKVAINGATWRLRMHAANGRDKLASGGVGSGGKNLDGIEERLQKLSKLHQSGLITQEEYDVKRKELIKQL
jgi:hypothetical protein